MNMYNPDTKKSNNTDKVLVANVNVQARQVISSIINHWMHLKRLLQFWVSAPTWTPRWPPVEKKILQISGCALKSVILMSEKTLTRAHLSANGPAALTRACVEVKVKQNTGVSYIKVLISIYTGF